VLLSKLKGSRCVKLNDTRPIVVVPHLVKIVEQAILNKLTTNGSKLFDTQEY